jgi:uncharacterized protein (DUF1778 family)
MSSHEPDSVMKPRLEQDRNTRDARINLRVPKSQAALIRRAAEAQDKSLTDFVVTSASTAAEQVLADRRWFRLDDAAWDSFEALLDRPAVFKPRLNELMNSQDRFVD